MAPRFLLVSSSRDSAAEVSPYLPANYYLALETPEGFLVAGSDNAGWTLKDYVIPRLLSGSISSQEISKDKALALGFKPQEMVITNAEALFWSNSDGWVDLASATIFGRHEIYGLNLPDSAVSRWVDMAEAHRVEALRHSLELS